MKIGFGMVYLVFVAIALLYELVINSFTQIAIVNYLLTGFLYASGIFILFFIIAKVALFMFRREK